MLRSILHCDMNNFYASVECMLDPALKKYPSQLTRISRKSFDSTRGFAGERETSLQCHPAKQSVFDAVDGRPKQRKDFMPPHYEESISHSRESVGERYRPAESHGMTSAGRILGRTAAFGPSKGGNELQTMKFELASTILRRFHQDICEAGSIRSETVTQHRYT